MSQLLEQNTKNIEQQPKPSFNLDKVAIDHTASSLPHFLFNEIQDTDGTENRRVGVAVADFGSEGNDKKSATAFSIDEKGRLYWTVGDEVELVRVNGENGSAIELGSDGNENGVIEDIDPRDEVYLISKEFASVIKSVGSFDRQGFNTVMTSPEIKADVVRVTFRDALSGEELTDNADEAEEDDAKAATRQAADRRRNKSRITLQDRFAALENKEVVTPVNVMQAFADDPELQAQIAEAQSQTKTDARFSKPLDAKTQTVDTSSLGISEAIRDEMELVEKERLAARVEKYTEKVATFEEIAAEALGRRMKGRLFNPLTNAKKEKAKQDDLNMHLLEGFSRALDGALMKQWLAEGYSDDEAAQKVYEHQQTRQEARAARNHEELRKDKLGSFLDKYANMSKGKKIGVAIGAAAAFGTIGVVAGAAGGALAVVGGIGLAGAKVGKTYLQQRSKIYETGRDESMRSPDALVSVENGNATKRTAAEQVFAGMAHDEKKREKAIQKSDRNKKVAAGLAAISAVAIGAGVAMKVAEHADDISRFWSRPLSPNNVVGLADGDWVTEASVPAPSPELGANPVPALETIFSADASTVVNGEGWYQTIQETTGVTDPAQQAAILQKIGPALQEKGWAYPMNDGTWGISRPGTLPKDVLELIKNSR